MSTATGQKAEAVAATYLEQQAYRILERNWRTRWCEIDLVAEKAGTIFFVEVKYRANDAYGGGLEYITSQKLRQMQFAAEFWMVRQPAEIRNYRLAALEVSGARFEVTAWLDDIS